MNGFIKINIGGKERGFKFGTKAIGKTLKDLNVNIIDLLSLASENPFEVYPVIFYHGAVAYCQKPDINEVVDFTLDDVIDWIDNIKGGLFSKDLAPLILAFGESMGVDIPQEETEPEVEGQPKKKRK